MVEDLKKDSCKAECQKELVSMKCGFLTSKLDNAKKLESHIEELTMKEGFMTENQVKEEEMKTKERLKEPLKIIANVEEFENGKNGVA